MEFEIPYDDAELRTRVEAILKAHSPAEIANIEAHIAYEISRSQPSQGPHQSYGMTRNALSGRGKARIRDLIWDLIIDGVLRPGRGVGMETQNDLPWIHMTKKGKGMLGG